MKKLRKIINHSRAIRFFIWNPQQVTYNRCWNLAKKPFSISIMNTCCRFLLFKSSMRLKWKSDLWISNLTQINPIIVSKLHKNAKLLLDTQCKYLLWIRFHFIKQFLLVNNWQLSNGLNIKIHGTGNGQKYLVLKPRVKSLQTPFKGLGSSIFLLLAQNGHLMNGW